MKAAEGSFQKLAGMPLTDKQRQRLYALRDALDLADNDALWSLIGALEWQRVFLEETPDRLGAALNKALQETKAVADRTIEASAVEAQERLAKVLGEAAQKVAADAAGTRYAKAFAVAVAVAVAALAGVWWQASRWGYYRGYAEAYAVATDQKVAVEWANTAMGRAAKKMDGEGTLALIVNCTGPGWRREVQKDGRAACFATGPDARGWYLP